MAAVSAVAAPRSLRIVLGFGGMLYGVPGLVAGRVVGSTVGAVLLGGSLVVAAYAGWRGATVRVEVDDRSVTVRNRWRTISIPRDALSGATSCTAWWMLLTRMASVHLTCLQIEGRFLDLPVMASFGQHAESPVVLLLTNVAQRASSTRDLPEPDMPLPE